MAAAEAQRAQLAARPRWRVPSEARERRQQRLGGRRAVAGRRPHVGLGGRAARSKAARNRRPAGGRAARRADRPRCSTRPWPTRPAPRSRSGTPRKMSGAIRDHAAPEGSLAARGTSSTPRSLKRAPMKTASARARRTSRARPRRSLGRTVATRADHGEAECARGRRERVGEVLAEGCRGNSSTEDAQRAELRRELCAAAADCAWSSGDDPEEVAGRRSGYNTRSYSGPVARENRLYVFQPLTIGTGPDGRPVGERDLDLRTLRVVRPDHADHAADRPRSPWRCRDSGRCPSFRPRRSSRRTSDSRP